MPDIERNPTLGVEIEMPVASLREGASVDASAVFPLILRRRLRRGEAVSAAHAGDTMIAVEGAFAVTSVDNGFNNLESAIGVVGGPGSGTTGLAQLAALVREELCDLVDALGETGAGLVNLSEHPAFAITEGAYRAMRAPKPIYDYWREGRGWRHEAGIDAKAQNGPTTGVTAHGAAQALNLVLLTAPAMVALYANSPFENGEPTGLRENRLTIWPRMFANPACPGDRVFHRAPLRPFASLADYLNWMFGPGRAMQVLPVGGNSYKGFGDLARVGGDPNLLAFLRRRSWTATALRDGTATTIVPEMRHLELLQFSQFLDGRIRFHLAPQAPSVDAFLEAMRRDRVEDLFAGACSSLYIEGRAAGATFPDRELLDLPDPLVAASTTISPSAIQKGLQVNPDAFARLSALLPWRDLRPLREQAIRFGLEGEFAGLTLRRFAEAVLDEAEAGLAPSERWMLAYPRHVLRTGQTGADRAIRAFERGTGERRARLLDLARARTVRGPLPAVPFAPPAERAAAADGLSAGPVRAS